MKGTSCHDDWSLCEFKTISYCYPTHLRCIYNVYKSHVIGCPGQEHLKACEHHQCPSMFKCLTTYCIPTYLLCDGVHHCPNGEDEQSCERFSCAGLLRCRYDNVCVHPSDICDGHKHCLMSGDDERFCNITMCPTNCTCHGSAIRCYGAIPAVQSLSPYFIYIMFSEIYVTSKLELQSFDALLQLYIVDSRFHGGYLDQNMFSHLIVLQTLVLHRNNIQFIQNGTFGDLIRLQHLDVIGNNINIIEPFSFQGLLLMRALDLSYQLLIAIEKFTFVGLINLEYINLSSNSIETLEMESFMTLSDIKLINLTNNSITSLSVGTFSDFQAIIMFSEAVYCCYLAAKGSQCSVASKSPWQNHKCQIIIVSYSTQVSLVIGSAATFIISFILVLTGYNKSKNIHKLLSSYLEILNLFPSAYTFTLMIIYIYHYGDHIYSTDVFPFSLMCLSLQIIAMCSIFLSQYTRFLIAVNRLLVTRYVFKRRPLTKRQGFFCSILGWCVSLGIVFLGYTSTSERHFSCFPMLYGRNVDIWKRADIWIYGVLSTVTVMATVSIYVSIIQFVHQQDKKFGRKGGTKLLSKTIITTVLEIQMYILVGTTLILYYKDANSLHVVLMVCFTMLYHGVSPTLYKLHERITLAKNNSNSKLHNNYHLP